MESVEMISELIDVVKRDRTTIPSQPRLLQRHPSSCSVTIISVYLSTSSFCASSRQS